MHSTPHRTNPRCRWTALLWGGALPLDELPHVEKVATSNPRAATAEPTARLLDIRYPLTPGLLPPFCESTTSTRFMSLLRGVGSVLLPNAKSDHDPGRLHTICVHRMIDTQIPPRVSEPLVDDPHAEMMTCRIPEFKQDSFATRHPPATLTCPDHRPTALNRWCRSYPPPPPVLSAMTATGPAGDMGAGTGSGSGTGGVGLGSGKGDTGSSGGSGGTGVMAKVYPSPPSTCTANCCLPGDLSGAASTQEVRMVAIGGRLVRWAAITVGSGGYQKWNGTRIRLP